ncbi:hypothetical protein Aph01nite_70370 [Acrocarpospora phusangensis]|uniref:Peptidase M48 domain-containing protein n=1 Tax=Acrocarpospora phusangensis TaxID=1070424 RepID=A0A919US41_9ACTN|nr:hypothetical protein [Acrocarpospora phusangensis]GIH28727.1 hypothetical protein Aph01nite_70370 [Acrocarpospora phusangensis]
MSTRLAAYVVAIAVHAFTLAFAALGLWTILRNPGFLVSWLLGGVFLGIGFILRPRAARLSPAVELLPRETAPSLYALAARVAEATGAPRPNTIAVDEQGLGAELRLIGLRREPVLTLGLPIWLALAPAQRVALLAVACANARAVDGAIIEGARTTLAELRSALFGAGENSSRQRAHEDMALTLGAWAPHTTYESASTFGRIIGWVIGWPAIVADFLLDRLTRGHLARERARALETAERVAGPGALAELSELISSRRYLAPLQAAALRGEDVSVIRRGALDRAALRELAGSAPIAATVEADESDRIDEELRPRYTRMLRGLGLLS